MTARHPRVFYNDMVQQSYKEFVAQPTVEWICKTAVSNADIMAERMFYFLEYIIKKDPSSDEDAKEAARCAILNFKNVKQYREHLAKICQISNLCGTSMMLTNITNLGDQIVL